MHEIIKSKCKYTQLLINKLLYKIISRFQITSELTLTEKKQGRVNSRADSFQGRTDPDWQMEN